MFDLNGHSLWQANNERHADLLQLSQNCRRVKTSAAEPHDRTRFRDNLGDLLISLGTRIKPQPALALPESPTIGATHQ